MIVNGKDLGPMIPVCRIEHGQPRHAPGYRATKRFLLSRLFPDSDYWQITNCHGAMSGAFPSPQRAVLMAEFLEHMPVNWSVVRRASSGQVPPDVRGACRAKEKELKL